MDKRRKLYEGDHLTNFRELVTRYKVVFGEKLAFQYKLTPDSKDYIKKTYLQFAHDIESLGSYLLHLGLQKKRIAIIAPNRYEWCVSYLAITTSDIIVVPLDKALPENEIVSSIIRSQVDAVIFSKEYLSTFSHLQEEKSSNLQYYICMDTIANPSMNLLDYSTILTEGEELLQKSSQYQDIVLDKDAMSIMLFTSGTTSLSKIVCLSQANICADIVSLSQMAKVYKEDVL